MNQKYLIINSILILMGMLPSISRARILSNVEVYRRCYTQLTQKAVPPKDPVLLQIKAGSKLPVAACMELLDRAKFRTSDGNRLDNPTDPVAINVLNTMNQVHQTFFLITDLAETTFVNTIAGMKGMYDPGEPALYYTKALFDSTSAFSSIVTSNNNLRADRITNNPTVSTENNNVSTSVFAADPNFSWASIGSLLGVMPTGTRTIASTIGSADMGATRGGGILGTPTYLLETVNEPSNLKTNSFTMTRKWAKSVISDFLCRELPIARLSDTDGFVDSSTNAHPFRQESACTQCHASMDRMAAVNRNFQYLNLRPSSNAISGGTFATTYPTNSSLDGTAWPSIITTNYYQRPTIGVLFYRDYQGALVNQTITSISDLGAKLATKDDFYLCAAKHYYQYFTGVNVDIIDPQDARNRNKGPDMEIHKTNVVNLGLALKTNQSLRTLINSIFNLDIYKRSDLGIQ